MGEISTATGILKLIIKYGPSVVKLGIEIWQAVEEFAKRKQSDKSFYAFDGQRIDSREKAMRFDTLLKAKTSQKGKQLPDDDVKVIRETVHKMKSKKKPGKAK